MALVGLVGWRGMVGSVLMDRMQAEGDFALISDDWTQMTFAGSTERNDYYPAGQQYLVIRSVG